MNEMVIRIRDGHTEIEHNIDSEEWNKAYLLLAKHMSSSDAYELMPDLLEILNINLLIPMAVGSVEKEKP